MYKEYIQRTYASQIDKHILRTENKMKTNYAMVILRFFVKIAHESLLHYVQIQEF
jgi:hypothetical protein